VHHAAVDDPRHRRRGPGIGRRRALISGAKCDPLRWLLGSRSGLPSDRRDMVWAATERGVLTQYVIHRGQHEIGGMCIEVAADDGTRILLDLGMPLVAPDGGDFPRGTPQRPTEELIADNI